MTFFNRLLSDSALRESYLPMPRQWIREFKDSDPVDDVFFVSDKQLRANRNAALYLSVELRDKTGAMNARMWNVTEGSASMIPLGGYVRARGKVQLYQGTLQMIVSHLDPVPPGGVDPADFEQQTNQNIEQMLSDLRAEFARFKDPALAPLMNAFLEDQSLMEVFVRTPAGVKAHHAYPGGLLEHVLTLVRLARLICTVYSQIPEELLLTGVFLHDIGKTRELSTNAGFSYTDEGQLIGHLVIGVEMLTEKVREVEAATGSPFPQELLLRLKHLVLSHHGTYEFGSPRLPMTPEAVALHYLDNLDAKVHEFSRAISDDPNGESHWTLFNARLDRKIFKGKAPSKPIDDSQ